MKTYAEKLRDPRWQKKRLEIMSRDNFTCRTCKSQTKTLNVHHIRYFSGRQPWDYHDWYLVTLCEACHKKAEDEKKDQPKEPKARSRLEQMMADAPESPARKDYSVLTSEELTAFFKSLRKPTA